MLCTALYRHNFAWRSHYDYGVVRQEDISGRTCEFLHNTFRVITSISTLDRDQCGVIWHNGNFPWSLYTR